MKSRLSLVVLLLSVVGCSNYPNYRVHQASSVGDTWYWKQTTPTTFHGICATMYGKDTWVVELPDSHPNAKGGSLSPTPIFEFNTRAEAEAWAEKNCPSDGTWAEAR
jgi:hypothetical protein